MKAWSALLVLGLPVLAKGLALKEGENEALEARGLLFPLATSASSTPTPTPPTASPSGTEGAEGNWGMRGFRRDLDNAAGLAQGHVVNAGSGGGGPGGLRGWKRQENNDDGEEGIPDVEGNFPPGRGWIKRDGSNDESPTSSSITGVEGNWGLRGFIKRDDSQETVAPTGTQGVEGNWGLRGFVKKMKKRQEGGDGDDDEGEGDETGEGAGNGVEQNWVPPRGWAK